MPGFDRTGPRGAGPRTGRGQGLCGDNVDRERGRDGNARLRGMNRGFARLQMGCRWNRSASAAFHFPSDEVEQLRVELAETHKEVAALKLRLEELERSG